MTPEADRVRSPCRRACRLDEREERCLGCRRTMDEIVAWPLLSDDAKRAVLERIARRRDEHHAVES